MGFVKKTLVSAACLLVWLVIPSVVCSQVTKDEDKIPYDMSDGDLSLIYVRLKANVYEKYTLQREQAAQAGQTSSIETEGVNEKRYSTFGAGLDLRFALLYAMIHKNKTRLRIGDDFGFGCFMGSNTLKVKDARTGEKINPEYKSSTIGINVGFTFYYGIQAMYRVSNTFDVGVRYLPLFTTGDTRISNSGTSYGLHARIKRVYLDWRITPYKITKYYKYDYESNGGKSITVKYLLPEKSTFRSNGYLFLSLHRFVYTVKDPYETGGSFTRPGFEGYTPEKSHFTMLRVGLGLMIH